MFLLTHAKIFTYVVKVILHFQCLIDQIMAPFRSLQYVFDVNLFTKFASCPILMLGGRWLLGPRIP
jgi:hypothetical protein